VVQFEIHRGTNLSYYPVNGNRGQVSSILNQPVGNCPHGKEATPKVDDRVGAIGHNGTFIVSESMHNVNPHSLRP
jgi:hypothetical protein